MPSILDVNLDLMDRIVLWKYSSSNLRRGVGYEPGLNIHRVTNAAGTLVGRSLVSVVEPFDRPTEILPEFWNTPTLSHLGEALVVLKHSKAARGTELLSEVQAALDRHCYNRAADKAARKTLARWNAYGDTAMEEAVPIRQEVAIMMHATEGLIEDLMRVFEDYRHELQSVVETVLLEHPLWQRNERLGGTDRRYSPELDTIFTPSQLRQLRPIFRSMRAAYSDPDAWPKSERALKQFFSRYEDVLKFHRVNPISILTDTLIYDCENPKYSGEAE